MTRNTNITRLLPTMKRIMLVTIVSGFVALAFTVIGETMSESRDPGIRAGVDTGWGSEALQVAYDTVLKVSPVAVANACGLGASSCFRCHNGKRATAASGDRQTAPWHPDHNKVNHSCAGCHKGNPRLMKQEMSHKDMLADPRKSPEVACAKCHQGGEGAKFNENYRAIAAGGK